MDKINEKILELIDEQVYEKFNSYKNRNKEILTGYIFCIKTIINSNQKGWVQKVKDILEDMKKHIEKQ